MIFEAINPQATTKPKERFSWREMLVKSIDEESSIPFLKRITETMLGEAGIRQTRAISLYKKYLNLDKGVNLLNSDTESFLHSINVTNQTQINNAFAILKESDSGVANTGNWSMQSVFADDGVSQTFVLYDYKMFLRQVDKSYTEAQKALAELNKTTTLTPDQVILKLKQIIK